MLIKRKDGRSKGSVFVEAALVVTGLLLVFYTSYTWFYPKLKNKLLALDLEQAMDMVGAVAPEPNVYEVVQTGALRQLLPAWQIRMEMLQAANRVSANTFWAIPACSILIEIPDITDACYQSPGVPKPTIDRSSLGSGSFGAPLVLLHAVASGDSPVDCPAALTNAFLNNEGGCVDKFRQLLRIDCTQGDRKAWGVVLFPDFPGYYDSCAVISTRFAQPVTHAAYPTGFVP